MEDPARQAVLRDWVLAESAEARRQLADDPSRAQFAAALKDVGGALTRVPSLVMAHARLMAFQRIGPADRVPRLVLRQGAQERVLIDPNTAEGTAVVAINNTTLSPDGRQVAVHTAAGGGEVGGITVYDVASGQPVGSTRRTWVAARRSRSSCLKKVLTGRGKASRCHSQNSVSWPLARKM